MGILFVNAAFRDGSNTLKLAKRYLKGMDKEITEIRLGDEAVAPLLRDSLALYNVAVENHDFSDSMFDLAKQFAQADEIVIAAPYWNYTLPGVLHAYLEIACTQGITFDINEEGVYHTMIKASSLTFITTSGGMLPEFDHAYGYIQDLCRVFWEIPNVRCIKAEGLDIEGTDVEEKLREALA